MQHDMIVRSLMNYFDNIEFVINNSIVIVEFDRFAFVP